MLFLAVLSAVPLFFGSLVQGYSNPGACSGACVVHDPAVIQRTSDGTYFRFSTGNKISIATASSIAGPWTAIGSALPSGSKINLDGNDDLWAPDISKVGNNYYLLYSVSTFGSQNSAIGYATSTTMEVGSWTDGGALFQSKTGDAYNAIDGNLLTASGNRYLQFGSFWTDIFQVPLNSAATASSGTATNIAFDPSGTHPVEGAFLYQHGGYYYLFFSHGICCGYDSSRPAAGEEYKIKVCRSTSPTGSFVDASGVACTSGGGTVVLESHGTVYGPGGQGIITHPDLGPVLFYHYVDTTIGYADGQKQFGWNQITWTNNWPTV